MSEYFWKATTASHGSIKLSWSRRCRPMSAQTTLLESTKGGLWTIAVPSLAAFAPSHSSLGLYLVSTLDQLHFALLLFHSTHSQLCSFPLYHSELLDSKVSALDIVHVMRNCKVHRLVGLVSNLFDLWPVSGACAPTNSTGDWGWLVPPAFG